MPNTTILKTIYGSQDYVLDVKLGKCKVEQTQDKLFEEFARISKISNNLPEPDVEFWNNWLVKVYTHDL